MTGIPGGSESKETSHSVLRLIRDLSYNTWVWIKRQRWFVTLTLGVLGSIIAYLIIAYWARKTAPAPSPTPKIIAAVGPFSGSQHAIWEEIYAGIEDAESHLPSGYSIQTVDDGGDPDRSINRASDICSKSDQYLMVLGFVESKVAEGALPTYEHCNPNVPVIVVAATSTKLTAPNRAGKYVVPVLRLPPSNYNQANMIVEALGDTFNTDECKLLLIKDQDNAQYANDLETVFTHILRTARTRCNPKIEWFDRLNLPGIWKEKWDAIVLFGMKEKATALLESRGRIASNGVKDPVVIVTDGATTEETLQAAASAHFPIWGVFPASQPPDEKAAQARHYGKRPSFYPYGYDAVMVASHAIEHVLARNAIPNRMTLKEEFAKIAGERGHFIEGLAGKYEFGSDGGLRFLLNDKNEFPDELLESYHFWYTDFSGNPEWQHRGARSSLQCFTPTDCTSLHISNNHRKIPESNVGPSHGAYSREKRTRIAGHSSPG